MAIKKDNNGKYYVKDFDTTRICDLMNKYVRGGLSQEEVLEFSKLTVDMGNMINRVQYSKPVPIVVSKTLRDDNVNAEYKMFGNTINVNTRVVNDIASQSQNGASSRLLSLVVTCCHEMTHYRQKAVNENYNELSEEDRLALDSHVREKMSVLNRERNPFTNKEISEILKITSPYIDLKNNVPEGYSSVEEYCDDIQRGMYLSMDTEKEAREQGSVIARAIVEVLKDSGKLSPEANKWLDENDYCIEDSQDSEDELSSMNEFKDFKDLLQVDTVFQLAEEFEGDIENKIKEKGVSSEAYSRALYLFLQDKTLEQKRTLLGTAIGKGYTIFGADIIKEILNDSEYVVQKEDIANDVYENLIDGAQNSKNDEKSKDSYKISYAKILSSDQIAKVVEELIKNGDLNSAKAQLLSLNSEVDQNIYKNIATTFLDSMETSLKDVDTLTEDLVNSYKMFSRTLDYKCQNLNLYDTVKDYEKRAMQLIRENNEKNKQDEYQRGIDSARKQTQELISSGITDSKEIYLTLFLDGDDSIESLPKSVLNQIITEELKLAEEKQNNTSDLSDILEDDNYQTEEHQYRNNLIYVPSSESARVIDQSSLNKNKENFQGNEMK